MFLFDICLLFKKKHGDNCIENLFSTQLLTVFFLTASIKYIKQQQQQIYISTNISNNNKYIYQTTTHKYYINTNIST